MEFFLIMLALAAGATIVTFFANEEISRLRHIINNQPDPTSAEEIRAERERIEEQTKKMNAQTAYNNQLAELTMSQQHVEEIKRAINNGGRIQ